MMKMKKCVFIAGLVLALAAAFVLAGCRTELVDAPFDGNKTNNNNSNDNDNDNNNNNNNGNGTGIPDTEGGLLIDGFEDTTPYVILYKLPEGQNYWCGEDGDAMVTQEDKKFGNQSMTVNYYKAGPDSPPASPGNSHWGMGFGKSKMDLNLTDYSKITFWVKGTNPTDTYNYSFTNGTQKVEGTFTVTSEWQQITVPSITKLNNKLTEYSFTIVTVNMSGPAGTATGGFLIDAIRAQ